MNADIIIINGKCLTMRGEETAEYVVIRGKHILEVGNGNGWEKYRDSAVLLDAGGNTVLPGFIDSNMHVAKTATNAAGLNLSKMKNFEEIGNLIQETAKKHPGEPIWGYSLQCEILDERRYPDRYILDKYCNNVPVSLYSTDYQVSVLNTYGMLHYKIPFSQEGVEMNEKDVPTGVFRRQSNAILYDNIVRTIPDERRDVAMEKIMNRLLANGITTIVATEGENMCGSLKEDAEGDYIYKYGSKYPIDLELFYQTLDIEKVKRMGLSRIGGELYIDGTIGAKTAALTFNYRNDDTNGIICISQEVLNKFVLGCYKSQLQCALFAIGDRAIDAAIIAHENAAKEYGVSNLRHVIEHAELITKEQMKRVATLGILLSMQPAYEGYWGETGGMYEDRLGEKYKEINQFREIIDSGIVICGGSDGDVTEPNPLLGIHYAVNHPIKHHSVSMIEALKMFTIHGAYKIFQESEKGTLEKDKLADVVILDGDICKMDKRKIKDMKIIATIKAGELLHDRL